MKNEKKEEKFMLFPLIDIVVIDLNKRKALKQKNAISIWLSMSLLHKMLFHLILIF